MRSDTLNQVGRIRPVRVLVEFKSSQLRRSQCDRRCESSSIMVVILVPSEADSKIDMTENKSKKLPKFGADPKLVEFFETHDMGEYESELPEVNFDVDIKQSHYLVSIDRYLMSKLLDVAKDQQVSVEILLDSWLKEKLLKAS